MENTATHLIIVRHGETTWNLEGRHQGHLDSPLSKRGLLQVNAVAERLSGETFTTIYSSDLGRAVQTAEVIGAKCGKNVVIDSRLREHNLGIFHGLTKEEMRARYPEEFARYRRDAGYEIPQGESARARIAQNIQCLQELAGKHPNERIVVVGHGGVLNSVFRHALAIPLDQPRRYSLANGSVNVVSISSSGNWRIEVWGDVSHLARIESLIHG